MAGGNPTQLPAYIALRYQENGVFDRFTSEADAAAATTKRRFEAAFKEVESVTTATFQRMAKGPGNIDLGLSGMRQEAAELKLYRDMLLQISMEAKRLAATTGDTTEATTAYIRALQAQRSEADRALEIADRQVATYTRLQAAIDGSTAANKALADSQRQVYAEQAKSIAAQVEEQRAMDRKQSLYASAYGMDRTPKSARDSASVFENWSVKVGPDLRDAVQRLQDGDAAIDRAALSGVTLENVLGRVANKGREVSAALQEAARAADEAARNVVPQGPTMANAAPTNTKFGAESILAGQAAMDRAAISGATLESVLSRLSVKGEAVAAAARDQAKADALASAEKDRLAAAVDRLQAELDPVAAATRRYKADQELLNNALRKGAISADFHAEMMQKVTNASHSGTNAFRNVINSQGAMRTAMLQSGQQMQDLAISIYSGQQASVVFAQQLPQLAFALSGLEGSANKTHDRIGRFATFLSGPWGVAVGLAVGVLGTLVARMFETGDEAEKASKKTYDFSNSIDVLRLSASETANAMEQLAASTRSAIAAQGDFLNMQAATANAAVDQIQSRINQRNQEMTALREEMDTWTISKQVGLDATDIWRGSRYSQLRSENQADQEALASARQAAANADIAQSQRRVTDSLDASAAATTAYNEALGSLNKERERSAKLEKSGDPLALATTAGGYVSKSQYEKRLTEITKKRDAALAAAADAKRTRRGSGRSGANEAERAARAAERLENFGDSAAESIARINEKFDETPRFVDQAWQSTRKLDAIIEDLGKRKPIGFEKIVADAEAAKDAIEQALVRPIEDARRASARRLQVQELISRGLNDEAAALQAVWDIEDRLGSDEQLRAKYAELVAAGRDSEAASLKRILDLYPGIKREAAERAKAEVERTRELERQHALYQAQLDVVGEVKNSLTDLFSGRKTNFLGSIKQAFADLQGKQLFDTVFGDLFDDLEKQLRGQSPLARESQRMADGLGTATDALSQFTSAVRGATTGASDAGSGPANDNGVDMTDVFSAIDAMKAGQTMGWNGKLNPPGAMSLSGSQDGDEIVVTHKRPIDLSGRSAVVLAEKISGAVVSPFEQVLSRIFGDRFATMLGGVVKEGVAGYMTGGKTGGILGTLKGIVERTSIFGDATASVYGKLNAGMEGAATGTQWAGMMKSLGIKTSTNGAQIGGAIGSMTGIPGMDIVGSIAGGIIGGMMKKTKWARVMLTSGGSTLQSNSGKFEDAVTEAGSSFNKSLQDIVDQFGGSMGDFGSIALGVRDGKWRVNTSRASLKKSKGATNFGEDAEAAMEYALMQAIERGAIKGIRESTNALMKASDDLETAVKNGLTWENVFRELKQFKDPMSAALDDLDKEFEKLIDLATKAGASTEEWAQLQELYGLKQAEIIKQQKENILGALTDLRDELTVGDSGLSLRDRQANAMGTYNALAARVAAGDRTAYDEYAAKAKELMDIEREMYGSQSKYFDRFNEVLALTTSRIADETNVISIAQNRDNPFDGTGAVKSSIDTQTEVLSAQLEALNANTITVAQAVTAMAANGYSNLATYRLAFAGDY